MSESRPTTAERSTERASLVQRLDAALHASTKLDAIAIVASFIPVDELRRVVAFQEGANAVPPRRENHTRGNSWRRDESGVSRFGTLDVEVHPINDPEDPAPCFALFIGSEHVGTYLTEQAARDAATDPGAALPGPRRPCPGDSSSCAARATFAP